MSGIAAAAVMAWMDGWQLLVVSVDCRVQIEDSQAIRVKPIYIPLPTKASFATACTQCTVRDIIFFD